VERRIQICIHWRWLHCWP